VLRATSLIHLLAASSIAKISRSPTLLRMTIIILFYSGRQCPYTSNHPLLTRHGETGDYHLADFHRLNDRITTSSPTPYRTDFHDDVALCDAHCCVVSGGGCPQCDAVYIIARVMRYHSESCYKCIPGHYNVPPVFCSVISDHNVLYEDQELPLGNNININFSIF
jgi:hypothetical protein